MTLVACRSRPGPEWAVAAAIGVAWSVLWLTQFSADLAARFVGIAAMTVGMMVPLALPAAGHVAQNSLRRQRREAVVTFLGAFAAIWILVALGAELVAVIVGWVLPVTQGSLIAATIAAIAWHWTPWRRRALRACARSRPLPPDGWSATEARLAFGVEFGARCATTCWPAMLLVMSAGTWHVLVALPLTVVLLAERSLPAVRRSRWIVPAAIGAIGMTAVILGPGPASTSVIAWLCQIPQS